jgi:hypothetical protein
VEEWGFIWIMLVLKIPLVALLWLVWWAVHNTEDPAADGEGGDGGSKLPRQPQTRPRWPRGRGPHGERPLPAPPRVRTAVRSRETERDAR